MTKVSALHCSHRLPKNKTTSTPRRPREIAERKPEVHSADRNRGAADAPNPPPKKKLTKRQSLVRGQEMLRMFGEQRGFDVESKLLPEFRLRPERMTLWARLLMRSRAEPRPGAREDDDAEGQVDDGKEGE